MKCLAQLCQAAQGADPTARLASVSAGGKHNAIPREASAVLCLAADAEGAVTEAINAATDGLKEAYGAKEPGMCVGCARADEVRS